MGTDAGISLRGGVQSLEKLNMTLNSILKYNQALCNYLNLEASFKFMSECSINSRLRLFKNVV